MPWNLGRSRPHRQQRPPNWCRFLGLVADGRALGSAGRGFFTDGDRAFAAGESLVADGDAVLTGGRAAAAGREGLVARREVAGTDCGSAGARGCVEIAKRRCTNSGGGVERADVLSDA